MENEVAQAYQELELRYQQALREIETMKQLTRSQPTYPPTQLLGVVRCVKCAQLMEVTK